MTNNEKFERRVEFSPAFDKRSDIPSEDYGIGSVRIYFILIGKKGAVSICLGTDWYLPETIQEYKTKGNKNLPPPIDLRKDNFLEAWSLDYHSKKLQFKGQELRNCTFLKKGKCYCDGSFLNAKRFADILLREGSDKLWKELENYYYETFKSKK